MNLYSYFSDDQIETALGQLMRALSGFQVLSYRPAEGEKPVYDRVPIVYGAPERVIANVLNKGSHKTNVRIPLMAAYMRDINTDKENSVSPFHIDEKIVRYNDKPQIMERIHGPALKMTVDVSMLCSSRTELYQLLEQVLLLFNPAITIQVDDTLQNPSYITKIMLEDISSESSYPIGTSESANSMTVTLGVPIRLHYPAQMFDALSGNADLDNQFGPDKIRGRLITQIITNMQDSNEKTLDQFTVLDDDDIENLVEKGYVSSAPRASDDYPVEDQETKVDDVYKIPPKDEI